MCFARGLCEDLQWETETLPTATERIHLGGRADAFPPSDIVKRRLGPRILLVEGDVSGGWGGRLQLVNACLALSSTMQILLLLLASSDQQSVLQQQEGGRSAGD